MPFVGIWTPCFSSEVRSIIESLKMRPAAGRDLINNETIKNLPYKIIEILVKIFNRIMYQGSVPLIWTYYEVCSIPKTAGGYRPISLASSLLKVFERMIKNRLDYFLETELVIPNSQFGLRKSRTCVHNVAILSTNIYKDFAIRRSRCSFIP